eukprot:m.206251 g.206251  ORF g.206251 m.206251 type:complete len:56 (+) comp15020_c0_seq2:1742-1909(+)
MSDRKRVRHTHAYNVFGPLASNIHCCLAMNSPSAFRSVPALEALSEWLGRSFDAT